jgi:hypothetical protein
MTSALIDELERRYESLEGEIAEALRHWPADDLMIADLKRRKLHIRDEIEQLRLRLVVLNWNAGTRTSRRKSPKHCVRGRRNIRR